MHLICKLYRRLCRQIGPRGMTFSAYAWAKFDETGHSWLRDRIDGWWLLRYGIRDHCQSAFQHHQRETKPRP